MPPGVQATRGRAAVAALAGVLCAAVALAQDPERAGPTLVLGGDVIFDATTIYAADRFFDGAIEPALTQLFSELREPLRDADLSIVNLECPIAPRWRDRDERHDVPTFAAPAELASALHDAGIDAVTVANNHAYDQGAVGLASTLGELARAHIVSIGGGNTSEEAGRAVVLERRGARIAIAAFTEGTNWRIEDDVDPESPRIALASEAAIARSVAEARGSADLVLVSLHWTSPIERGPTRRMRSLAQAAADAGADVVYAHGPHVPARAATLTAEDGRVVPVLWSIGNLAAWMIEDEDRVHRAVPSVRDAMLVRIETSRQTGAEAARLSIRSISARAYWITAAQRAWWTEPTTGMTRPLSIDSELRRLEAARCGARCDRYANSYRARRTMIERMVAPSVLDSGTSTEPAAGPAPTPVIAAAPPASRDRAAPDASAPSRPGRRARVPGEPSPIPPDLATGVVLRVRITDGRPVLADPDEAQIRAIAALLRADHSLRVEIVARPARHETGGRSLAIARAHQACGLIAIRGPSRSRFTMRAGAAAERASILVRVLP